MPAARIVVGETLNRATVRALTDAVREASQAPAVSLVILEGEDPGFCRGLDLEELTDPLADRAGTVEAFAECLRLISLSARPTLAWVNGSVLGGGVGLAAACDVVLADESATFALPELLLGLVPATILPVLLGRMTAQQVRLWALSGKTCTAEEAHVLGLVDEVVAASAKEAACCRWERLLRRANPRAVASFKRLLLDEIGGQELAVRRGAARTAADLTDEAVVGPLRAFWLDGTPPWEDR